MNGKMLLLFAASLVAYGQTPVVRSAIINSTTNQITIAGSSLLPASGSPVVYLDGELLTLLSSSSSQIVATMPALPAGSFRLLVGAGVFDVTNSAVGPAGFVTVNVYAATVPISGLLPPFDVVITDVASWPSVAKA